MSSVLQTTCIKNGMIVVAICWDCKVVTADFIISTYKDFWDTLHVYVMLYRPKTSFFLLMDRGLMKF